MIIEFLAKSSELILHNRLSAAQTLEGILNKLTDPNPSKFQLSFAQKFNFMSNIPIQWSSQHHKLLVIEFFVCLKNGSAKTLVEQWIFDLNQISESQLENTIDSTNTLYKRLSVLLRSIATLTVTLPLYQLCFKNLERQFKIEHSISFTRHTISKWHPKVYETNELSEYSCPDFVLPGRTFSFKVNYLKSLHSLPELLQEIDVCEQPLVIPSESGGSSPIIESDLHLQNKTKLIKRYYSENTFSRNTMKLSNSHIFDSQINSCQAPLIVQEGSVPSPSLPKLATEVHNNNSPTLKKESLRINSRIRIKTLDSEHLGEAEVFICENDEEKFTEVLSLNEINLRSTSSPNHEAWQKSVKKFSDHEKHRKISEDFENSRRRLSLNTKAIEKVIEQSDDDKIAELLLGIEGLKVTNSSSSNKSRGSRDAKSFEETKTKQMGIRFELTSRESKEELPNQFNELDALRDFYWEIKGSSPIP